MVEGQAGLANGWVRRTVMGAGETMSLLTRSRGNRLEAVPAAPRIARDKSGRPMFSATLLLERQPRVGDPSIEPLIQSGLFGFTVSVGIPEPIRDALENGTAAESLFARPARFGWKLDGKDRQTVEATGPDATAAFSQSLTREDTLAMLETMRGEGSGTLTCDIDSVFDAPPRQLRVFGRLAEIYDDMAASGTQPFDRSSLEARVAAAIEHGSLGVTSTPEGASAGEVAGVLLKAAPWLVRRIGTGAEYYTLGTAPGAWQQLDVTFRSAGGPQPETLHLEAPLGEVLGDALGGGDLDPYLKLVVPGADGTTAPANNRTRQPRMRAPAKGARPVQALMRRGGKAVGMAAALRPQAVAATDAHVLMASGNLHAAANAHDWYVDDLVLVVEPDPNQDLPLPQIDDAAAPLWPDKRDASKRWYVPSFSVLQPDPRQPPEASPFTFVFSAAGHTASGALGLEGEVRFTLRAGMSDATLAAFEAEGRPETNPVPLEGLSVQLEIPFRDTDGTTRSQPAIAEIAQEGDLIRARVRLLDDWLRLAYGALAMPGFQASEAMVRVAHTFRAYMPVADFDFQYLAFTRKESLVYFDDTENRRRKPAGPIFNTGELAFRTDSGNLQLMAEKPLSRTALRRRLKEQPARTRSTSLVARPVSTTALQLMPIAIKPNVAAPLVIADLVRHQKYAVQTRGRDAGIPGFFPCSTLGAFYLQETEDGRRSAIGCQDTLTLGQTAFRLYERIAELDHPQYTVLRSLQQPGRFILVPARFVIGRFAATELERAFRPAIVLYSTVDAEQPDNNQCVALASLVPDIGAVQRLDLLDRLATLAESPVLSLLNEIEAEVEYDWATMAGFAVSAIRQHDAFQLSIGARLDFAPQLQAMLEASGVNGSAVFTLPDGTRLETGLVVDLTAIAGPEPTGPVTTRREGTRCTLTNELAQPVNVLMLRAGTGSEVARIDINRQLDAHGTMEVQVPDNSGELAVDTAPVSGSAATLEEIRSFVEDIHTNVAFVNLVNFANHQIKALKVTARLRGQAGEQTASVSEQTPVCTFDFVLPLTDYLSGQTLEFNTTKTLVDDTTQTSDWLAWDLTTLGNVVSLTWELID